MLTPQHMPLRFFVHASCVFRFGVKYLVHPGGSIGDAAVTAAADAFETPSFCPSAKRYVYTLFVTGMAWSWPPVDCACFITEIVWSAALLDASVNSLIGFIGRWHSLPQVCVPNVSPRLALQLLPKTWGWWEANCVNSDLSSITLRHFSCIRCVLAP